MTYEQLKDEFIAFYWSHGKDACVKILLEFKVGRLCDLNPARYATFSLAMSRVVPTAEFMERQQRAARLALKETTNDIRCPSWGERHTAHTGR